MFKLTCDLRIKVCDKLLLYRDSPVHLFYFCFMCIVSYNNNALMIVVIHILPLQKQQISTAQLLYFPFPGCSTSWDCTILLRWVACEVHPSMISELQPASLSLCQLSFLAFFEGADITSWATELIRDKYKHILCIVQAGQCRWPASSLFSVAGWRTRRTWRTCWTTSVTSESPCSFYYFLRAQTWLVRRYVIFKFTKMSPFNFGADCPHFSCFSQNVFHQSYTFALALICKYTF